jgi:hypothetical protein
MEALGGTGSFGAISTVDAELGYEKGGAEDMTVLIFISGVILGGLLGVLVGPCVSQWWPYDGRRTHDIDRLIEQFQVLFQQRGQEHHPRP